MGREIRRVTENWEHPKKEVANYRLGRMEQQYQPLHDRPFWSSMDEWYADAKKWADKSHEYYDPKYPNYWDYGGGPPDPYYYRPDWPEESMTWVQMYETVSEGTPVTPAFATAEELVSYLCTHGTFWDETPWRRANAEAFVKSGWAPSLAISGGTIYTAENMEEMP